MRVAVRVSGDKACFRRPECREDFVSYDMMTPLAALRMIEGLDGVGTAQWTIEGIDVLRPIRFGWIDSVEQDGPIKRRINALIDVEYVIHAHRPDGKADDADFPRSRSSFLGLRECPAIIVPISRATPAGVSGLTVDLGWMLYDLRGKGQSKARFFRARLVDGRLTVPPPEEADLAI